MTLRAPWAALARAPELLLAEGERALAFDPDAARAVTLLRAWHPPDDQQAAVRERLLAFCAEHPGDAHRRTCAPGHLTASALVVDAAGERALLTHHRKLDRWLQLGGHCDGDANLPAVALREAREEGGLDGLRVLPAPVDLDVHAIPARPGEPEHLHLDVRFLVLAPPGARPRVSAESHELGWFGPDEVGGLGADESVLRLFRRCFA